MKKIVVIILTLMMLCMVTGCAKENGNEVSPDDYDSIEIKDIESFYIPNEQDRFGYYRYGDTYFKAMKIYNDFAIDLFNNTVQKGENEILAPLSVCYALAIAANGAQNDTRKELESALGFTIEDLNAFLLDLSRARANEYNEYYKMANAFIFNQDLDYTLKDDYVQIVNEYYGDIIAIESFGDKKATVDKANNFAYEQTDGAIDDILSEEDITKETLFILMNAMGAGDEWLMPFDSNLNYVGEFHNYNGKVSKTDRMFEVMKGYYCDDQAEGFVKELRGSDRVVVIVPNEGVDVYDYLAKMDGQSIFDFAHSGIFETDIDYEAETAVDHFSLVHFPKFEYTKEYDLRNAMIKMGLKNIFDRNVADFKGIADGDGPIFIEKIKQKSSVLCNEEEFRASAVTTVMGGAGAAGGYEITYKFHDVVIDRPFIYALCNSNMIYFVGVVSELADSGKELEKVKLVEVNSDEPLPLMSGPSSSSWLTGFVEKGTKMRVVEEIDAEGYKWYKVSDYIYIADNGEWLIVTEE